MSLATEIYTALSGSSAVAALVSTRIYPGMAPTAVTAPYIIFQQIASDPDACHQGAAGAVHRMFQFACFADSFLAAETLRDAVIAALDGVPLASGESPTLEGDRAGDFDEAVELHRADCDFLF